MQHSIPLLYKDRRAEGKTVLRQCQLVQLHLLHVFDAVCREHGLTYVLSQGSMLGAVRHNGFIPWDDDLDVAMPRKDYEKFIAIAATSLPDDVYLQTPKDIPYRQLPISKLRDAYSFYCEIRHDISMTDPNGIFIDIFPYDEVPTIWHPLQILLVRICGSSWMRARNSLNLARYGVACAVWNAMLCSFYRAINISVHAILRTIGWFVNKKDIFYCIDQADFIFRFDAADLFPAQLHKFEDGEFSIPNNAEKVLTVRYGNWREPPPPEKRHGHAGIIDPFHAIPGKWSRKYNG